ncbi:MAG: hypothetical protein WBO55_02910 [Rhizobiaceae bacterium]
MTPSGKIERNSFVKTASRLLVAGLFATGLFLSANVRQAEASHQVGYFIAGALVGGAIAHHIHRHHHKQYRIKKVRRYPHYYPHPYVYHPRPVVAVPHHHHRVPRWTGYHWDWK